MCLSAEARPTAVLLITVSDISRAVTSAKAAASLEDLQRRNQGRRAYYVSSIEEYFWSFNNIILKSDEKKVE